MPHLWPEDTDFALWELDVLDRDCPHCGRRMYICDHRDRHLYTLDGPVELVCKLNHCPDPRCPGHSKTKGPEVEPTIALPGWGIGWDVSCWIGHRRCSRHWAIPQIRAELHDSFAIDLTEPGIAEYIQRSQAMLAARQQEFAEALLSATAAEVRRLIARAKQWAEALGKTVALWISDKQDAFVTGIAAEFPGVPHRYCANQFLRDLAKPVLEADSYAKVQMRTKGRGLRGIEQTVLKRQDAEVPKGRAGDHPEATATVSVGPAESPPSEVDPVGAVVLDYTAAVRGILNDDQGGPLHPPGLRMAEALGEVRESIQRNLDLKKGDSRRTS